MPTNAELEESISNAQTDAEKLRALVELALEFRTNDPKQALSLADDTLALIGNRDAFKKEQADALYVKGVSLWRLSDYPNALLFSEQSLFLYQELGDKHGIANALNSLGNGYNALAIYPNSLSHFQQCLTLRQDIDDKQGIANTLNNLGSVYHTLADYPKALSYFQQSLSIFQELGDKRGIAASLGNVGNVYYSLADYPNALNYHQQSLAIKQEIDDTYGIAFWLNNLGNVYQALANYSNALSHHQQSLAIFQEIGNKNGITDSLFCIGKTLASVSRFEEAETHLNQALALSEEVQFKKKRFEILKSLADLYAKTAQFEKAYQTHQSFHDAEKEVFNADTQKQLAQIQARLATEQAKREAELQKKDAELQRLKNVELAGALAEAETQKQRAEEANKLKSELLAIAAHDLKNPLQSIMGFAQLLPDKAHDSASVIKYADTIERSSSRMLALINDLLKSMRFELVHLELQKQPYDVSDLVNMVAQINLAQMVQKEQRLHLHLAPNSIADMDVSRMQEVFDNLVSNAVKYSPKGGNITIRVHQNSESDKIITAIQDEGQGLTEEDKSKLFGRFQRLSAQPTGGESSTGLGLSIVKQIVELHSGRVWAESEGVGKGSTFFVELPSSGAFEKL